MLEQVIDLFLEFRGIGARANQDQGTGFSIITGARKFKLCRNPLTATVNELQLELVGFVFVLTEITQEGFKFALLRCVHHIDDRGTLEFIEVSITKQFHVNLVGKNMHSFMDIGNGIF